MKIHPLRFPGQLVSAALILATGTGCSSGLNLSSVLPVMNEPAAQQPASDSLPVPLPAVNDTAALSLLGTDETLQTLDFPIRGTTTVDGRISGRRVTTYAFPVRAGQQLEITMDTSNSSAYFNIHDVLDQSGAALFSGAEEKRRDASVNVLSNGTLLIRPLLLPEPAGRGESAEYSMTIERI